MKPKQARFFYAVFQNELGLVFIEKIRASEVEHLTNRLYRPPSLIHIYDNEPKAVEKAKEMIKNMEFIVKKSKEFLKQKLTVNGGIL